jgi:hypothetical protein
MRSRPLVISCPAIPKPVLMGNAIIRVALPSILPRLRRVPPTHHPTAREPPQRLLCCPGNNRNVPRRNAAPLAYYPDQLPRAGPAIGRTQGIQKCLESFSRGLGRPRIHDCAGEQPMSSNKAPPHSEGRSGVDGACDWPPPIRQAVRPDALPLQLWLCPHPCGEDRRLLAMAVFDFPHH